MIGTIVACFVTMFVTAFFFSAVSLTRIKEADAEAAKWKALADYEAAEKHRALNDLNAERMKNEVDRPTPEQVKAARYAAKLSYCDAPAHLCKSHGVCPGFCYGQGFEGRSAVARAWLASHGLPVEEPEEAKA